LHSSFHMYLHLGGGSAADTLTHAKLRAITTHSILTDDMIG